MDRFEGARAALRMCGLAVTGALCSVGACALACVYAAGAIMGAKQAEKRGGDDGAGPVACDCEVTGEGTAAEQGEQKM